MSDYLFGRRAEPVWRHDLKEEVEQLPLVGEPKGVAKEMVGKYDKDRNGKVEPAEREGMSAEDQARLAQAGMGGAWWASALYTVTPNWQLFWLADALEPKARALSTGAMWARRLPMWRLCRGGIDRWRSCCSRNGS